MSAVIYALSEICHGHKPGFFRSLRGVGFITFKNLILTLFVLFIIMAVIMMFAAFFVSITGVPWLLIVILPALMIISIWMGFVFVIVVLEGKWMPLERLNNLSEGVFWRNTMILLLFLIIVSTFNMFIAVPSLFLPMWARMPLGFISYLIYPLVESIYVVMYFDMRARRGAYVAQAET